MNSHGHIYKIENVVNGKAYIGATANYTSRVSNHRSMLKKGNHYCKGLQSDYNELTQGCFIFAPIIICQEWQLSRMEEGVVMYHHENMGVYNHLPHLPYSGCCESLKAYMKRKEFYKKNNLVDVSIEQAKVADKVYRYGVWYDIAKIDKRRNKVMITRNGERGWWSDIDFLNYYKMKSNDITTDQLREDKS